MLLPACYEDLPEWARWLSWLVTARSLIFSAHAPTVYVYEIVRGGTWAVECACCGVLATLKTHAQWELGQFDPLPFPVWALRPVTRRRAYVVPLDIATSAAWACWAMSSDMEDPKA